MVDVRALRSVPTPLADALLARGLRSERDLLARPEVVIEALREFHGGDAPRKAEELLAACNTEAQRRQVERPPGSACGSSAGTSAGGAWGASASALALLQRAQEQAPIVLPCDGLARLLGGALRPGAGLLEVCGLPGAGKTQFCLQLCAAAQIPWRSPGSVAMANQAGGSDGLMEAVFVDAEGCFVPHRYAEICEALLVERRRGGGNVAGLHAHGSRELVDSKLAANNHQRL
eukprot:TRINITY_DN56585_c0_g1_i1.p1 TRINITY_DN56585_c0_g1~~TRINITY_DN56585_c0_g1_i1.p1  ORF type:complete len:239 (-),score=53.76 TRINITY_DN56585_c0_g1_i1:55-750(-)